MGQPSVLCGGACVPQAARWAGVQAEGARPGLPPSLASYLSFLPVTALSWLSPWPTATGCRMNQRPHLESRSSENRDRAVGPHTGAAVLQFSRHSPVGDINCGGVKEGPLAPERPLADATAADCIVARPDGPFKFKHASRRGILVEVGGRRRIIGHLSICSRVAKNSAALLDSGAQKEECNSSRPRVSRQLSAIVVGGGVSVKQQQQQSFHAIRLRALRARPARLPRYVLLSTSRAVLQWQRQQHTSVRQLGSTLRPLGVTQLPSHLPTHTSPDPHNPPQGS